MIVRILTEDQFRLDDEDLPEMRRLDDELEGALNSGDSSAFDSALSQLVSYVRGHGHPLGMDEVLPSEMIVPAPDMTLEEARARLHAVEAKQSSATE
ncbi:MAG TPA: hypothetical protein VKT52_01595 [Ktedonobacterales bacterium]|nr:hypothetical protein [Ktedonobacterales bacterium]